MSPPTKLLARVAALEARVAKLTSRRDDIAAQEERVLELALKYARMAVLHEKLDGSRRVPFEPQQARVLAGRYTEDLLREARKLVHVRGMSDA